MMITDQFGRPFESRKLPEKRPLAAAPILDTWREYVSAGLTPQKLSALLKEADAGDVRRQAELFDQMEGKDAHLLGEAEKRRNAILDIEFEITPATDDRKDIQTADFIRQFVTDQTDWDDVLAALQDGVGKGYSALEINWDVSSGQAVPTGLEFIDQKRFLFRDATGYLRKHPLLLSDVDSMGAEIPAWKILFHSYGGKSGHPARSGIYRVCAWMYLFRNYALKDWVAFLEVFGMPLRLGRYDSGASKEDKDALITAIQSLGSDAAGIISKNTEIEFVEAVKSANTDNPYKSLAEFCGKEISKALLGQTLSADVGDTGSYAAAKTHNEVRLDLAKADTRSVAATVRNQLIRPIVGFNFGWDALIPGYAAVWKEEEDLEKKSLWVTNLLDRGVEMPVSFVNEQFHIPEPKKGERVISFVRQGPVQAKRITARINAERFSQDDADNLMAQGAVDAQNALDELLSPVLDDIDKAQSFAEIGELLYNKYPTLDTKQFQEILARAITATGMTGYAAAKAEEND
jgi:phage gp29-like protein